MYSKEVTLMNHSIYKTVLTYTLTGILCFWVSINSYAGSQNDLEQNKTLVMEAFAALDAGVLDDLDNYIAADYVRHCQATPGVIIQSLEDFKALLQVWSHTYSDVETKVDTLVAEGDLVAFYGSFTATQIGPMGPFPATGKQMVSEFAGYHRITEGKISGTWVTWDNLAALAQLGLFPPSE
jgi:predicted ester cyclase